MVLNALSLFTGTSAQETFLRLGNQKLTKRDLPDRLQSLMSILTIINFLNEL